MKKMNHAVRQLVFAALVLSVLLSLSMPSVGQIAVGISVRVGPPALPVYDQPICPGPGYVWTPGYWAWNDDNGYYWVPGTWVVAPVGMLWTPGYWGWSGGLFLWHGGYWGRHVGFYGGINYGFGYGGVGFGGGEWRGRSFFYNRSVTNVNVTNVTNVYNKTVIVNKTTVNNVSYNGGTGGVVARPTPAEEAAGREPHQAALAVQSEHEHAASQNRQLFASENHGRPAVAATGRAGEFSGHNVVAARAAGSPYHAPAMSPHEARGASTNMNRPGNAPNARGSSNNGFQKFGQTSRNGAANNNRASNVPRPGNQAGARPNASRPRGENTARAQNMPRPSSQPRPQPHTNARTASAPRPSSPPKPAENHSRGGERRPNEGH
jgi:hypothetical protein